MGSVQGKAQGWAAAAGRSLEGARVGRAGERKRGRAFQGGLLLFEVSKMSLEPPTWDPYFQNLNI